MEPDDAAMLIKPKDTLDQVAQAVKGELNRALKDRKHPFRFVVFSTAGNQPCSRYVVLRDIQDHNFIIYTDRRSGKHGQIESNPNVQLLFYHPAKRVQVIISGVASLHDRDATSDLYWSSIQGDAIKSYTSKLAPGTVIHDPEEAYHWDNDSATHFSVIRIKPDTAEVLQLHGVKHARARFETGEIWQGEWLVP